MDALRGGPVDLDAPITLPAWGYLVAVAGRSPERVLSASGYVWPSPPLSWPSRLRMPS